MDKDPLISPNNEKQQEKPIVFEDEDDDDDFSPQPAETTTTCLTQSSFLVPRINLGRSSPTCKNTLGASIAYGLISTPGNPSQKNDQELFVLDKHLLPGKITLNPMAREFKPGGCSGSVSQFSQNDYSSMARRPAKMCPVREQYACKKMPNSADDKLLSNIAEILNNDKLLILMRGCPGSGKSTLAKKIYDSLVEGGKSGVILSTDNYFDKDGSHYQYDSAKLPGAHAWNKSQAFTAMKTNTDLIIIDNTNVSKWEMAPYVQLAFENGYKVQLVEPNTNWKFSARRLFEHNIHGVSLNKIQDMLSRYEKNVTVNQLMRAKKPHEENSHTDRNTVKPQRRERNRGRKKSGRSRDTNNNKDNNCNSDNHSSTSPPETLNAKAFSADNKTDERFLAICRAEWESPDISSADQKCVAIPRRNPKPLANRQADLEFSDIESWGSDEWYEPQAQRQPKKKNTDQTQYQHSDSESSSENFHADVLDISQSLYNKKNPAVVENLAVLTLKCIETFGNDEIYERASLATVKGCQIKNEILLENFEKKFSEKPFDQGLTLSTHDEDESLLLAYSMEYQKESPGYSTPEDSEDISPEEQNEFYLNFVLQSDFTNLLAQMFGPINNLNIGEADRQGNLNLKLNYDDMKSLHETLTKICAVKKGIGSSKKKKKTSSSIYSSMKSSSKETFVPPPDSLSQIMKEQEEAMCQLEQKLQRNDDASARKLKKLCSEFPAYDPNVIEEIFKENDYNMHKTLAVLQGHPQDDAIDWRFDSNTLPTDTAPKNKPRQRNNGILLKWLKVLDQDQKETVDFYNERLKDNINKRNMYCDRHYYIAASYFEEKVGEFKMKLKTAQLDLVKQNVSSRLTMNSYNKIDLHGMNKHEVAYIVRECLEDYAKALERSSSMKRHLIFITGKGANSKNKKPVLKPYVTSYLEKMKYRYVQDTGEVKVFF